VFRLKDLVVLHPTLGIDNVTGFLEYLLCITFDLDSTESGNPGKGWAEERLSRDA
jgi:hypothetical protein